MLHPERPLRTLDDVARLLRQNPVRQQLTTLSHLQLIPELLITWDDQDLIAAPSALGDLLRVQGRLPGLSKRSLRLSLAMAVAETMGGQPVPNRPGAIHFPEVGETCSYRQVLAMLDEGLVEAELPDWYLTEIAAINRHLMEADRPRAGPLDGGDHHRHLLAIFHPGGSHRRGGGAPPQGAPAAGLGRPDSAGVQPGGLLRPARHRSGR